MEIHTTNQTLDGRSLGNNGQTNKTCIMYERNKRALYRPMYEEVLRTFLVEVESTLNSRPLTSLSDDYNDLLVLISNHLLTSKLTKYFGSSEFPQSGINSRKRWKSVQALANMFWTRFIKEYLPTLQERKKMEQDYWKLRY